MKVNYSVHKNFSSNFDKSTGEEFVFLLHKQGFHSFIIFNNFGDSYFCLSLIIQLIYNTEATPCIFYCGPLFR